MLQRKVFCSKKKSKTSIMDKINEWELNNQFIKIISINTQLLHLNMKQEFQGALVDVPMMYEFVWIYYEE